MKKNKTAKFLFLSVLAVFGLILFNAKNFSLADSTATSAISVSVSPSSVYAGGSVEVAVSVVPGTVSQTNSVAVKLVSPTAANYISLENLAKDSQGIWRGLTVIPSGDETGEWKVYRVQTTDAAGNIKAYYYNNDINVTFTVMANAGGGGNVATSSCEFIYSNWSDCQNGVQTRTVSSTSPSGCYGGTPALSQTCSICAVAYSSWGVCVNGQQNRTVISKQPEGCVVEGLTSVLARSCILCSEYKYSDWGVCVNGQQNRTILYGLPTGCTSGQPEPLTQSCQNSTCQEDEWVCQGWGDCTNGVEKRICNLVSDCLNVVAAPQTEQTCTVSATSTPTSTVSCNYKYSDWSVCENGKQKRAIISKTPAGCSEGSAEALEKYCTAVATSSLPACTLQNWKCGDWSVCNSEDKQTRGCSLDSNCVSVSVSAVKPAVEKSCIFLPQNIGTQPQPSASAGGTGSTTLAAGNAGETQDQLCIRAGFKYEKDCQWYLYQSKITKECLEKGLKDQNKCREYFLGKYGKPLKCQGMDDEKCNSLINGIILSDLNDLITPEIKKILSDLSGSTAIADGANKILAVNTGDKDKGTAAVKEVKVESFPLSQSGGRVAVALLPIVASGQQDILSPVAIGFDANSNGIPDDAESRLGSLPQDRSSATKGQLALLSGIDQALVQGKPLEQPKLSNASSSDSLTVGSIKNATSSSNNGSAGALKFQGKAKSGQVVTLFVYSPMPIVLTVKADENGNWVYDLDKSLSDGTHEVYAVINDNNGRIVETSLPVPFFIQEAKAVTVDDFVKTQNASAVPDQSANIMTFYLIGGGAFILMVVVGFLLFRKRETE